MRQGAARLIGARLEPEIGDELVGARECELARLTYAHGGHDDVLSHGEPIEQVTMLEGAGERPTGAHIRLRTRDVTTIKLDRAGIRQVISADDVETGCLTSTACRSSASSGATR